jgi:methylenetetrahydrofolate reductase (NADPH)
MKRFKEGLLSGKDFVATCELVPGRGHTGTGIDNIMKFAEEATDSKYIYGLSLTDNAGGNPALCADILGPEIQTLGPDLLVHFSCKDMNRNMIEARAYALKRAGVTNLLVITGDYPISGAFGLPKPVFDIDAVIALHYLRQMNEGLEVDSGRKPLKLDPTDFFLGAVASPFKATEASAYMQYYKMEKKIRAGAHFIVTQLGYDSRKFAEFYKYVRQILGHRASRGGEGRGQGQVGQTDPGGQTDRYTERIGIQRSTHRGSEPEVLRRDHHHGTFRTDR